MKAYRVQGTTDECTTCELCGKPELKGTVVLVPLDADGNPDGDPSYFGTSCAAKAAGWTVKEVRAGIKAAKDEERACKDVERIARREREVAAFTAWKIERFGTADTNEIREIAEVQGTTFVRITEDFFPWWNAQN